MTKTSYELLEECKTGYIQHSRFQWKRDDKGTKRLVPHFPDVRYEPVINKGKDYKEHYGRSRRHRNQSAE